MLLSKAMLVILAFVAGSNTKDPTTKSAPDIGDIKAKEWCKPEKDYPKLLLGNWGDLKVVKIDGPLLPHKGNDGDAPDLTVRFTYSNQSPIDLDAQYGELMNYTDRITRQSLNLMRLYDKKRYAPFAEAQVRCDGSQLTIQFINWEPGQGSQPGGLLILNKAR